MQPARSSPSAAARWRTDTSSPIRVGRDRSVRQSCSAHAGCARPRSRVERPSGCGPVRPRCCSRGRPTRYLFGVPFRGVHTPHSKGIGHDPGGDEPMTTPPSPRSTGASRMCTSSRSATTFIDGKAGELRYRGYSIHDLAKHSTFEETTYLLLHGELPTRAQLASFKAELSGAPPAATPRCSTSLQPSRPRTRWTCCGRRCRLSPRSIPRPPISRARPRCAKGVRLASQVPMIVAAHHRIRSGKAPVAPDPDLSSRRQLPLDDQGREAVTGRRPPARYRPGAACRAWLQRVIVCRARRHRHPGQHPRRRDRRHCHAVRPGARRRGRRRAGDGARRSAAPPTSPRM